MARQFSAETVTVFEAINTALYGYLETTLADHLSPEVAIAEVIGLFNAAGLDCERSGFNQQRLRYNAWAERDGARIMVNWLQVRDRETGLVRSSYDGCLLVTVDQYYSDRSMERLTRIIDFSANREAELGRMIGRNRQGVFDPRINRADIDPRVEVAIKALWRLAGVNARLHRSNLFSRTLAAISEDEAEALRSISHHLAGANAMIDAALEDGIEPDWPNIFSLTASSEAMDRFLALPGEAAE